MNFLAHLHLSGTNDYIKIGNFIGDSVKGKSYQKFAPDIQKGILLHRKIDYFTDKHIITKDLSKFFAPKYRKYSGIVVDIIYDYYLANNWNKYSNISLEQFISDTHNLLMLNFRILPLKIKKFLPFLIGKKRLLSYRNISGIAKRIGGWRSKTNTGVVTPEFAKYPLLKSKLKCPNEKKQSVMDSLSTVLPDKMEDVKEILTVDGLGISLKQGWLLVRPSGTEPVIRITCEGPTDKIVKKILETAESVVKSTITSS